MSWSHIVGHDSWIDAFRNVKRRGRLAHAYLFVGPEGVGKRTFAIELAKALLCENPQSELTACDKCAACSLVDARTHPDLFLVSQPEDKNEFPIETMRAFFDAFGLKPARGHGKVAIIDDVDAFNDETANSSLKTLEEPPANSLLILIGTSLDRQLPTIRSRCQTIRFAPLTRAKLEEVLKREPFDEPGLLPRILRQADGSPGLARALAEPALWNFRDAFLTGLLKRPVDSVQLGKDFAEFAEKAGKEGYAQRDRARRTLKLVANVLREAIRRRLERPDGPADSSDEDARLAQALSERASPEKWLAVLDRCLQAEIPMDRYISVSLVLEALVDGMGQVLNRGD